jgi:hypothetical protein
MCNALSTVRVGYEIQGVEAGKKCVKKYTVKSVKYGPAIHCTEDAVFMWSANTYCFRKITQVQRRRFTREDMVIYVAEKTTLPSLVQLCVEVMCCNADRYDESIEEYLLGQLPLFFNVVLPFFRKKKSVAHKMKDILYMKRKYGTIKK